MTEREIESDLVCIQEIGQEISVTSPGLSADSGGYCSLADKHLTLDGSYGQPICAP